MTDKRWAVTNWTRRQSQGPYGSLEDARTRLGEGRDHSSGHWAVKPDDEWSIIEFPAAGGPGQEVEAGVG